METGAWRQVCNPIWSKNVNELVSTHDYSHNQIIVWRYPTMSKLATLTGHTYRVIVLYLAISPDGQTIVTGAGDETLRFWNVFPSPKSQTMLILRLCRGQVCMAQRADWGKGSPSDGGLAWGRFVGSRRSATDPVVLLGREKILRGSGAEAGGSVLERT
ncbi:Protein FIZZY-RELATED 1 [Zea mays]|uniref:Protein FIZZY-RELATED 1 n=1 Tax=Zea mays TaxID=4577 RepID=A0A3L6EGS4_MAIZE|nr:Protein FIZZY-RELATED 1 [Zea mays]